MTDDSSDQGGKVGYKLPPIHSRFQNGPSGNPRGRLKGVRNFAQTSNDPSKSQSP